MRDENKHEIEIETEAEAKGCSTRKLWMLTRMRMKH